MPALGGVIWLISGGVVKVEIGEGGEALFLGWSGEPERTAARWELIVIMLPTSFA